MTGLHLPPWPDRCGRFLAGISDDLYHQEKETVSSSFLKTLLAKSPAHARAEQLEPRQETPALILGKAVHCLALEPDDFQNRYAIAPQVDRRTKSGKAEWAEFLGKHPGKTILKAEEGALIEAVASAVLNHPIAGKIIDGGQAEVSGYFNDPTSGLKCRVRPDCLRRDAGVIVDLKSAIDASPSAFSRAVASQRYHLQAAFYSFGYHQITGENLQDFVFVVVEKTPPFAVAVYRLADEAIEQGWRECRQAMDTCARCLEAGCWPGYSDRIEEINLPVWAFQSMEEF